MPEAFTPFVDASGAMNAPIGRRLGLAVRDREYLAALRVRLKNRRIIIISKTVVTSHSGKRTLIA